MRLAGALSSFRQCDAEALPFADREFDVVAMALIINMFWRTGRQWLKCRINHAEGGHDARRTNLDGERLSQFQLSDRVP
jgi:histidyl-tRNA synthetase